MKKFGQKIDNNVQVSAYRRKIHVEDESDWIDAMEMGKLDEALPPYS